MHGFGNNAGSNSLVLINNIPFTSFSNQNPNINSILVNNIKKIEISPGSHGTLYGDQAVGGIVNIVTEIPQKAATKFTVGLGNRGQQSMQFFINRNLPSYFSYSIGGFSENIQHIQQHNKEKNYNINTLLSYQGKRNTLKLGVTGYQTQIEFPNAKHWYHPENNSDSPSQNYSRLHSNSISLQNHLLMTDQLSWDSNIVQKYVETNGKMNWNFRTTQSNLLWDNRWHYHEFLIGGFYLQKQKYSLSNKISNDHANANVSSGFIQTKFSITEKIHLILGGRYAYQSIAASRNASPYTHTHADVFVNEEGIKWNFQPNWTIYIRRDSNYRFAKADEKLWTSSNLNDLKMQIGTSYESGLQWHFDENNVSFNFYRLDLKNEIAYNPQPADDAPFGKMSNLPPTRRNGIDINAHLQMRQHIFLNLQSSLVDASITSGVFTGKKVPAVSSMNNSASINYEGKQWSANISQTYHGSSYASDDLSNQGDKMPGYFLTNININKRWKSFTATLGVNNLFNKNYVRFANYFEFQSAKSIEYYPADGRSIMLKISVDLS